MRMFVAAAMLGGLALTAQATNPQSQPLPPPNQSQPLPQPNPETPLQESQPAAPPNSAASPEDSAGYLPTLPPAPKGKSTIMGGQIRDVDPVRDQFLLHTYGQRPMKILYDERTLVFRDGVKIPLRDLGSEDRASVETILDGSNVFAISIHILSQAMEGDCAGRVLYFDPSTRVLVITSDISPQPVRLEIPASASIAREGEPDFTAVSPGLADLMPGALIRAAFESDSRGSDVAKRITVLAVPGAGFVFYGDISFVDVHDGYFILVDPRDQKSYQIYFDPARFATSQNLRVGLNVTVKAVYDGARYSASEISVN